MVGQVFWCLTPNPNNERELRPINTEANNELFKVAIGYANIM
jgi:hypothetical protein